MQVEEVGCWHVQPEWKEKGPQMRALIQRLSAVAYFGAVSL